MKLAHTKKCISFEFWLKRLNSLFQMTDIEFSDWYFLFLSPSNNKTDVENLSKSGFQDQLEKNPAKLSASAASSVSKEVSGSLAEKLQVPVSQFRISSVEQYKVFSCIKYSQI